MRTSILSIILILIAGIHAFSQQDTLRKARPPLPEPYHKNVIKFNPTPMLLLGEVRNLTFSYERILKKNQSVAVQAGYLLFPRLIDDTLLGLINFTGRSKQGINLGFDYRYYPWARNRRPVPDGMYIGGYTSYYGFQFMNDFDILRTEIDQKGSMTGKINILNMGLELGYQFVFWKRMTVDLILFGPSFSMHQTNLTITGDLNKDDIDWLTDELAQKLVDRFPILAEVFSKDNLVLTGSNAKFGLGFRYSIQVGFHF